MKKIIVIVVAVAIAAYAVAGFASYKAVAGKMETKAQQLRAIEAELSR